MVLIGSPFLVRGKTLSVPIELLYREAFFNIPVVLCVITSEPNYPTFLQNVKESAGLNLRRIMVVVWVFKLNE